MAELPKTVKVRATARGFVYWLRNPGEVFEIAEHHFSRSWMEKIESEDEFTKLATAQANPSTGASVLAVKQASPTHVQEPTL